MIIDAHHHFWNLDRINYFWLTSNFGDIYRNIEAPELLPLLQEAGIDQTVVVQAMNSFEETNYLLEQASLYPWVAGVIGWIPLDKPDEVEDSIKKYIKNNVFKGIRHLIHEEEDPDWVVRDNVIRSLKILEKYKLTFDVVAEFPNHLKHVPYIAENVPGLKIVIDHLAKPPTDTKDMKIWSEELYNASQYTQVYAKISGLNTAIGKNWSDKDLVKYVDFARDCFGAERLMFGSDWPINNLAGNYREVWEATNRVLQRYPQCDIDKILGETAQSFYSL